MNPKSLTKIFLLILLLASTFLFTPQAKAQLACNFASTPSELILHNQGVTGNIGYNTPISISMTLTPGMLGNDLDNTEFTIYGRQPGLTNFSTITTTRSGNILQSNFTLNDITNVPEFPIDFSIELVIRRTNITTGDWLDICERQRIPVTLAVEEPIDPCASLTILTPSGNLPNINEEIIVSIDTTGMSGNFFDQLRWYIDYSSSFSSGEGGFNPRPDRVVTHTFDPLNAGNHNLSLRRINSAVRVECSRDFVVDTEERTEPPLTGESTDLAVCSQIPVANTSQRTACCMCLTGQNVTDCSSVALQDRTPGIWTSFGCIPIDQTSIVRSFITLAVSLAGGLALLLILYGAFTITTAAGNPEKLKTGQEIITAAIAGLIFILFSVVLLDLIGVEILAIPGFGQ